MKTPRELILERHQSAEAKLKAIRAEDLAACARSARQRRAVNAQPTFEPCGHRRDRLWQEALWPWRRVWIGVAAIWLVILALEPGHRRHAPNRLRQTAPARS